MFEASPKKMPTITLTPLIDVVFFLLIFVILAANFDRIHGLQVHLPSTKSGEKQPGKAMVLTITKRLSYNWNGKAIEAKELESVLRRDLNLSKVLILRVDRNAAFEHAVKALDLAKKAGYSSVSIATHMAR